MKKVHPVRTSAPRVRRRSLLALGLCRRTFLEQRQLALEVVGVVEVLVHARKAQVRDIVDASQSLQYFGTDLRAAYVGAEAAQRFLDSASQGVELLGSDRTARGRRGQAPNELVAVESFAFAAALDDEQGAFFDALIGRESNLAFETLAAPTSDVSII